MQRIQPADSHTLRPLVTAPHNAFVLEAMIAGNSPAAIWTDNPVQPSIAFAWDKTHSLYLAGDTQNTPAMDALKQFIADEWMPLVRPFDVFKVYPDNEAWHTLAQTLFPVFSVERYNRVFFGDGDFDKAAGWQNRVPAGFRMAAITQVLLANAAMKNADRVIEEISSCWNDISQFYTDGFGYCLVTDDDEIVGWCTAEYRSDGKCGIGIETIESFQKRGFATLTASAFVEHCRAHSIIPHWDSWAANTPSVTVAEKVGFRKVLDYAVQFARIEDV
jgi:hypothetical protein